MKRNLYVVMARSGSNGVPHKNVARFGGIPALAMRIIAAKRSGVAGDIVCSTDSDLYASIARDYGAECPFMRPAELAGASTPTVDVLIHCLDFLATEGREYDNVFVLEPSSPFSRPFEIAEAYRILEARSDVDSAVSVRHTEPSTRFIGALGKQGELGWVAERLREMKSFRRQDVAEEVTPSGAIYAVRVSYLQSSRAIYSTTTRAFLTEKAYSLEIDSPEDLSYAHFLWDSGAVDKTIWL